MSPVHRQVLFFPNMKQNRSDWVDHHMVSRVCMGSLEHQGFARPTDALGMNITFLIF